MTERDGRMDGKSGRDAGPAAGNLGVDIAPGVMSGSDDIVCYCGLREECPAWNVMNDEERRACSSDKRMTAEYFWKHRLVGA